MLNIDTSWEMVHFVVKQIIPLKRIFGHLNIFQSQSFERGMEKCLWDPNCGAKLLNRKKINYLNVKCNHIFPHWY